MHRMKFAEKTILCREGENVLDACFRQGIDVPFSCRKGTCQVCIMRVVAGEATAESQHGLSDSLIKSGHFLPCQCHPRGDLEFDRPITGELYKDAQITSVRPLSDTVCEVCVRPVQRLPYQAGQFLNVLEPSDGMARSYSICAPDDGQSDLILHVQRVDKGVLSRWLHTPEAVGQTIKIHYPLGEACWSNDGQAQSLVLIATGSGLGVALAIAQAALAGGFTGLVQLYHGVHAQTDLYLQTELAALSEAHPKFKFHLCVSGPDHDNVVHHGRAENVAFSQITSMQGCDLYLFGNPGMVRTATSLAVQAGLDSKRLYADAFEYKSTAVLGGQADLDLMEFQEERRREFKPEPDTWAILSQDDLLQRVLHDFYTKVFADELLSPYFKGVTKSHVIGKQFAFLHKVYTGKDVYFGDHPRNAHHWMVISNEIFDHRERLFAESLDRFNVPAEPRNKLLTLNESYRSVIVKTRQWPRVSNGVIEPLKGFEVLTLEVGGMCDACGGEIPAGVQVKYHAQTGELYCNSCS